MLRTNRFGARDIQNIGDIRYNEDLRRLAEGRIGWHTSWDDCC
jgi:hypothetical protein